MRKIQEDAAVDVGHKYDETNQLKKEQRQNIFKEKECLNKKTQDQNFVCINVGLAEG